LCCNAMARDAGGTPSVIGVEPDIAITTTPTGHITGATILGTGTFATDGELVFPLEEPPSQYVPPAPNTAAQEDYFHTEDQWTTTTESPNKVFARDIIPTTATITYDQPSVTTQAQNGNKYVRSGGFIKTRLEVSYTNLSKDEFQVLSADVQAARGQTTPFYLLIKNWGEKVLTFKNQATNMSPRLVNPYVAGEKILTLGGFDSDESEVFKKGEIINGVTIGSNGGLLTVLNTVDANVYGEAKIRIAYGSAANRLVGDRLYKDPYWVAVTLNNDEFQYNVSTFGLYNATISFETGVFG